VSEVHKVKIDRDGRYIIVIKTEHRWPQEDLQRLQEDISTWWEECDEKFVLIHGREGFDIQIERIG